MRSLTAKLTLAFLFISVLGTVMVAVLVNWQTRRQFGTLVDQLYQHELEEVQTALTHYYQQNNSWQGVENFFFGSGSHGSRSDRRSSFKVVVTLADSEQRVIFGRRYHPPELLPDSVIEQGSPVEIDGETVGWVIPESAENPSHGGGEFTFSDSPEAEFLANLNSSTVWISLGTAVIGLFFAILLARTISHPVSELKTATEQVAQGQLGAQVAIRSSDEIGQLAASFNQMSTDLARSNELRCQMTADIAHDLRTPLSVIQGYTEALDEGKLPGDSEIFGTMHKQVKHLNRLVEDLRTLSLADAGQLSLHPFAVAPRDLLEHSLLVYAPQAEQQQVTLHLELPPDPLPTIEVDPDRMVQVLGNLISNALRHTPAGGEIRLAAMKSEQNELLLMVQDSGVGIPAEDLPHVFDRFYRGDKARSENGESGLGLAIARSIVVAHNGRITATSSPDKGATFTITLPAQIPATVADGT